MLIFYIHLDSFVFASFFGCIIDKFQRNLKFWFRVDDTFTSVRGTWLSFFSCFHHVDRLFFCFKLFWLRILQISLIPWIILFFQQTFFIQPPDLIQILESFQSIFIIKFNFTAKLSIIFSWIHDFIYWLLYWLIANLQILNIVAHSFPKHAFGTKRLISIIFKLLFGFEYWVIIFTMKTGRVALILGYWLSMS